MLAMIVNKMRKQMSEEFLAALKENIIPWHRDWDLAEVPQNAISENKYRGLNVLWLEYVSSKKGYSDPRWCTFNQAKEKGWRIKKGEKGTSVEFYSFYDKEQKATITNEEAARLYKELEPKDYYKRVMQVTKNYTVFNAAQIEGIPAREKKIVMFPAEQLLKQRDVLLKNMQLKFEEGGDGASYSPGLDRIKMPLMQQFKDAYGYMSTFLHEAGHATGHPKRLHRDLAFPKGSPEYAREELCVEIASAFVAQEINTIDGTERHMQSHKAYIQSWIQMLEKDPNELFYAIRAAEKIADYLIEKGEFHSLDLEKEIVQEEHNQMENTITEDISIENNGESLEHKQPVKILGLYEWQGKDGYVHYKQGNKQFLTNGETLITDVEYVNIETIGNMNRTRGIDSKLFAEKLEFFHPEIGFSDSQIRWIDISTEKANVIPPEDNGIKILGLYEKESREHYIHFEIGGKKYLATNREIHREDVAGYLDKILAKENIKPVNAISKDILPGISKIPYYYADRLSDTLRTMVKDDNIVIKTKTNRATNRTTIRKGGR